MPGADADAALAAAFEGGPLHLLGHLDLEDVGRVGPRPHPLGCRAEDELFWAIDDHYFERHAIKPGLTGLAQVRGLRGETATATDLTDRLQADLEYIDGWHIGRDLAIMFRTLGVLVHPKAF